MQYSENTQLLQKYINTLTEEDSKMRKKALLKLYSAIVIPETPITNATAQALLPRLQKPILKRLSDKSQKCRQLAINILKELFDRADDISISFPYLFPIIVERLNAVNLEGTDNLPQKMKPTPTQKPQMIIQPIEPSQQIRLLISQLITIAIVSTSSIPQTFAPYLDDITNILRALAMDPFGEVVMQACNAIKIFCEQCSHILLHFSTNLGRSCFTAIVHKHAKIRIAGMKALTKVMYCGAYKYSYQIIEALVGFRDPNIVPIKQFYQPSVKLNYMARMINDGSSLARQEFYKMIGQWLTNLPDKFDHQARLVPYLLTGLFDQNDQISKLVGDIIEEIGVCYEQENEQKLRQTKQYAIESKWTRDGNADNLKLHVPKPLQRRPRLGARNMIRNYTRRYLKAIYSEIGDWIEENRIRSANLLLYSIVYSQDFMTQFLDNLLLALYKGIIGVDGQELKVKKRISQCAYYLGRFCQPKSYQEFVIPALRNQLKSELPFTQCGAIRTLGYLMRGSIQCIPIDQEGFQSMNPLLDQVVDSFIEDDDDDTLPEKSRTLAIVKEQDDEDQDEKKQDLQASEKPSPFVELDCEVSNYVIEMIYNILKIVNQKLTEAESKGIEKLKIKQFAYPLVLKEKKIFGIIYSCLGQLELVNLYGKNKVNVFNFKSIESKSSQQLGEQCFKMLDQIRLVAQQQQGMQAQNGYDRYSNQILFNVVQQAQKRGGFWNIHSKSFKSLATFIIKLRQNKMKRLENKRLNKSYQAAEQLEQAESLQPFELIIVALKSILLQTRSTQVVKSSYRLLTLLIDYYQKSLQSQDISEQKAELYNLNIQDSLKRLILFKDLPPKDTSSQAKQVQNLFNISRQNIAELFKSSIVYISQASQGFLQSLGLRLKAIKLPNRKAINQLIRTIFQTQKELNHTTLQYLSNLRNQQTEDVQTSQISSIIQTTSQGYDATEAAVQYDCALTLHQIFKFLYYKAEEKNISQICQNWILDLLLQSSESSLDNANIPTKTKQSIKSHNQEQLKRLKFISKEPAKFVQKLLQHAVDDGGSTRVEVLKTLMLLKKFAIPGILLWELIQAKHRQSFKRIQVLIVVLRSQN